VSGDPYIDLETGVLRNRLGITDAAELAQAESELTSYRLIELRRTDLPGRYDLPHLQGFHRYIFGDLYDWAGELRSVSIGKSDLFCLPQYLGSFAEDVFGKLAWAGYLRGLERVAFVDGLTMLLADVNALHPFREGNGRTQRAFLAQLARDAGHPIHWAGMDPRSTSPRLKRLTVDLVGGILRRSRWPGAWGTLYWAGHEHDAREREQNGGQGRLRRPRIPDSLADDGGRHDPDPTDADQRGQQHVKAGSPYPDAPPAARQTTRASRLPSLSVPHAMLAVGG
jgi:cell filamentation protein